MPRRAKHPLRRQVARASRVYQSLFPRACRRTALWPHLKARPATCGEDGGSNRAHLSHYREECPKVDCQRPIGGSASEGRRVSPDSFRADVAGSPAYGCRSPSGLKRLLAAGVARQSYAAKRPPILEGTAGHPRSPFPMRAASNHLPGCGRPATTTRRGVRRTDLDGKSGVLERTCLPHTNTDKRLI
jgi:hypothetical protein